MMNLFIGVGCACLWRASNSIGRAVLAANPSEYNYPRVVAGIYLFGSIMFEVCAIYNIARFAWR